MVGIQLGTGLGGHLNAILHNASQEFEGVSRLYRNKNIKYSY